jgi:hypothetical protein
MPVGDFGWWYQKGIPPPPPPSTPRPPTPTQPIHRTSKRTCPAHTAQSCHCAAPGSALPCNAQQGCQAECPVMPVQWVPLFQTKDSNDRLNRSMGHHHHYMLWCAVRLPCQLHALSADRPWNAYGIKDCAWNPTTHYVYCNKFAPQTGGEGVASSAAAKRGNHNPAF